jgi:hypothetical protein
LFSLGFEFLIGDWEKAIQNSTRKFEMKTDEPRNATAIAKTFHVREQNGKRMRSEMTTEIQLDEENNSMYVQSSNAGPKNGSVVMH